MDTKERHVRENASAEKREAEERREHNVPDEVLEESMPAEGRNRKRHDASKINRLWIWFGVLVLVAILIWWLFSIGIIGDMENSFNG